MSEQGMSEQAKLQDELRNIRNSDGARLAENGDQLQVGRQEKELYNLDETVKTLGGRLNHVLTPAITEQAGEDGQAERPPLSPLAERIDANNRIISRINSQLSDIIRRLEC